MIDIYGTFGPSCADIEILKRMIDEGMTGMRLNTSHISVREAEPAIRKIQQAAKECGAEIRILIDLIGPELRIGGFPGIIHLEDGETVLLGQDVPVPQTVLEHLSAGKEVSFDDGKILLRMKDSCRAQVIRGGRLLPEKSVAVLGTAIDMPAVTEQDRMNIHDGAALGIYGVMQPFTRSREDLETVRKVMDSADENLKLFAKIENRQGIENLESFFGLADEIVIARGDLGNSMPLWELPGIQKNLAKRCRNKSMPFMVVTQLLSSMEQSAVPTRAEVSDIYNAVCDGAASVMVTGETAAGRYPVEVIKYLSRTVKSAAGYGQNEV